MGLMTNVQNFFKTPPWVERRGEHSYRVRWRLPSGTVEGASGFKTQRAAEGFRDMALQFGPQWALRTIAEDRAAKRAEGKKVPLPPKLRVIDGELPDAVKDAGPLTVQQMIEQHLDNNRKANAATKKRDRQRARDYIYGPLGDRVAADLTTQDVEIWMGRLDAATDDDGNPLHTFKHKKNIHSVLSSAYNAAVANEFLPGIVRNPARGVKPRETDPSREPIALTMAEIDRLLELVPERWRLYVTFFASTGMRSQEINALRVGHLDFDRNVIEIRKAVKYSAGMGHKEGMTKTKGSRRDIRIPTNCRDALLAACQGRGAEDYVFTNTRGGPVKYANFHDTLWTPLVHEFAGDTKRIVKPPRGRSRIEWIKDGKGRRPTPHDLRHSFATLAVAGNVPLPVVQRQLGHSSITTTVNVYSHVRPEEHQALAEVLAHRTHLTTDGEHHELAPE